jgi:hypothetical protein
MASFQCERCHLEVKPEGFRYTVRKIVVPTILTKPGVHQKAHDTGVCPVCGLEMTKQSD